MQPVSALAHAKCLWPYLQGGTTIPCGVTTVAPESTGVYWIPLFEILEQRGIRPCLVNARHMKNVPGRRAWRLIRDASPVPIRIGLGNPRLVLSFH